MAFFFAFAYSLFIFHIIYGFGFISTRGGVIFFLIVFLSFVNIWLILFVGCSSISVHRICIKTKLFINTFFCYVKTFPIA